LFGRPATGQVRMHERQCLADCRITEAGEPPVGPFRQGGKIFAYRLDEQELGQPCQNLRLCPPRLELVGAEAERTFNPAGHALLYPDGHDARQQAEDRQAWRVDTEEATEDARLLAAAAMNDARQAAIVARLDQIVGTHRLQPRS